MRADAVARFRSPGSGARLRLVDAVVVDGEVTAGALVADDGRRHLIDDGVPNFVDQARLTDIEARTQAEYDRVADDIYDAALDWQFAAMREDEDAVRESMLDMLQLAPTARVLEVGCGTARDSFRLARRLGPAGLLHLQDLSSRMVLAARRKMQGAAHACALEYSVSNGSALPFPDGSFEAVFHFGGFNQFDDPKAAAREWARVTTPGGRIVFGDEGVAPWLKGTEFDAIVSTNNPLFKADIPLTALPVGARDVTARWTIGNCFYVIGFANGDGPPPLDLDLPHRGWRGGTLRSRYFGAVDVSVEAKQLAREAAIASGVSVHDWLDALVRERAAAVLRKPTE